MYPVVSAGKRNEAFAGKVALVVMAKAPRAGKVKTRLAPVLGFDGSAAINVCFLRDTARNIAEVCADGDAVGMVCYTPVGDEALFEGILPEGFALIAQRGDAFGERLLAAAEDVLSLGFAGVCLIDSDSPTIPQGALVSAVQELAGDGDSVVLGGSHDGGYYLIGMKLAHAAPFERITWSTELVFAETVERCDAAGLDVVELPLWYDVDDAVTLAVLERELVDGVRPEFARVDGFDAAATREFLRGRQANVAGATSGVARRECWRGFAVMAGWKGGRAGKAWVTNTVLCGLGYALLMMARQFVSETDHFTIGFSGVSGWSAVLWIAAVFVVLTQPTDKWTVWIVLGWAVAFRAMTLFEPALLSTDIYRYVWDGIVQHAGVNPYRYVPGDPALSYLREPNADVFASINRRDYAHTIYPPVAQMMFWLATFFEPSVQCMKAMMFVFEGITAAAVVAMLRRMGRPAAEVLLYAWCPLLVWEIGGAGHVDAVIFGFVALAMLFRFREQPVLVGLFLGAAVMTKFYPIVLVPALWKRGDWKMPAVLAAVVAVGYAVYSSVGMGVFGFLGGYQQEEGINTGERFYLLEWVHHRAGMSAVPKGAYLGFCVLVMGALAGWCWRYATREGAGESLGTPHFVRGTAMLALAMMLLFAPHYPWYVAWLIPLFALTRSVTVMAYVAAFFYGFTTMWADGTGWKMYRLNSAIYGVVLVAMVIGWAWRRWKVAEWWECRG